MLHVKFDNWCNGCQNSAKNSKVLQKKLILFLVVLVTAAILNIRSDPILQF